MRGDAVTLGDITGRITRLTVRARDAVGKSIFSKQEEAKARQAMTTRMPAAPQHKGPSPITKETLKNSAALILDRGKSVTWRSLQLRFRLFSVCP